MKGLFQWLTEDHGAARLARVGVVVATLLGVNAAGPMAVQAVVDVLERVADELLASSSSLDRTLPQTPPSRSGK